MSAPLRILIVGGYGRFGGRLVELIEDDRRLVLIVAGRSLDKARAYCAARGKTRASLTPARFDREGDIAAQLAELKPGIVVDASGPFQAYGENPYALIEASIARRIPYLDLADATDFVAGVGQFDEAARNSGIYVLAGVSSFPVLTAAAVRRLAHDMARVKSIRGGIAPSPYAGVGTNVIRAIASYAGRPVALRRAGKSETAYPFTEQVSYVVAPPGHVPLPALPYSLVDVPDLRMLQELWPEVEEVWIGVAPVPKIFHRALIGFAWAVRARLLPPLTFLAPLMDFASNHLFWGEHRGGMFVEVEGRTARGEARKRSWHMLAEGDHGPLIPSMAAAAIIRKTLDGNAPPAGARAATKELELEDYDHFLAIRSIVTGIREEDSPDAPVHARVLGSAWRALPEPIRAMHMVDNVLVAEGRASVERGKGVVASAIASLFGFPAAGTDVPVTVTFRRVGVCEIWRRDFAGRKFSSTQFVGEKSWAYLLCERFGPIRFGIALAAEGERLTLVLRRWSLFGVPLPLWLAPRSEAFEHVQDGRFHFHVEIGLPLVGRLVRYRGWLVPRSP
jgi:hypothetical protein